MKYYRSMAFSAVIASLSMGLPESSAFAQTCEISRPVMFGDLDWDSAVFHNAVARFIIEKGFGCKTDALPGSTVPIFSGVVRGDIDIVMEVWSGNKPQVWVKGLEDKKVLDIGANFDDAVQRWYVPRYLVEGAKAPAKGLKSVADLPKYKALFRDPEEPSKGRFYNCIAGWECEVINDRKLRAYGLDADYVNFRPGTGAALAAAIESAIKRKRPILFYYWEPTWLMGKLGNQVVPLQEPTYDEAIWQALMDSGNVKGVRKATAYPPSKIVIGVNADFARQAPQIVAFLSAYRTSSAMTSAALASMKDNGGSATKAGIDFLKKNEAVWSGWLSSEAAQRVKDALDLTPPIVGSQAQ